MTDKERIVQMESQYGDYKNHDLICLLQTRLRMAEEDLARLRSEIERERDDRYVDLCEKYQSLMNLLLMAGEKNETPEIHKSPFSRRRDHR